MLISCLCPTYNRAPHHLHLLNESVESFFRQELPRGVSAELVILNDTPEQSLECNHGKHSHYLASGGSSSWDVRIVNTHLRYPSLGEKRNALVQMARGNVLVVWDDDDIPLAGRILQAWDCLHDKINKPAYFNPGQSWLLDRNGLHHNHSHGYCHNASAFTRAAWEKAGGYPATSGNEDALMDGRLRHSVPYGSVVSVEHRRDWHYIYRWGVAPCHLSGRMAGPPDDPHAEHYAAIGQRPIVPGTFTITPEWYHPYDRWCAARSH